MKPNSSGKAIIINSPTHQVVGFLSTTLETLVFPSQDAIDKKKADESGTYNDDMAYALFITSDSVKIGAKLLVAYQIVDALKALQKLGSEKGILKHIENLAVTDMGKVVQQTNSNSFTASFQTQPKKGDPNPFTNPDPIRNYQDIVVKKLHEDLIEYGIEINRFSIESFKIMDADFAKSREKQAMMTAEASAKESVMEQNYRIKKKEAEQNAETERIKQEQLNSATVSKAKAEYDAAQLSAKAVFDVAQLSAQAMIIKAEAEQKVEMMKGQTKKKLVEMDAEAGKTSIEMRGEAERNVLEMKSKVYHEYSEAAHLEDSRIHAEALSKANLNVTSEEFAKMGGLNPLLAAVTGGTRK